MDAAHTYKAWKWMLALCFVVQLIFAYNSVGFFHPDQHFQLIEFSSYHLGNVNGAGNIWELKAMIRPSLQIHLFSGFYLLCTQFGISNPFVQLTFLQLLTGISMFFLFNGLTLHFLKHCSKKTLLISLMLLNLSWAFPFIRTLFSSETLGAFLFFGAIWLYDVLQQKKPVVAALLTGLLMGFAFFARFQMGFAIAGWLVWQLLIVRHQRLVIFSLLGLVVAIGINLCLDYWFYHQWVFTPWLYFKVNIIDGVANTFGESSFLLYVGILAAVLAAPLLSVLLFFVGFGSTIKNWRHPLVLATLFFVVGHCVVGHKEDRFMFPIFSVLPAIVGLQLDAALAYLKQAKKWLRVTIKVVVAMGAGLNLFLLLVLMITPYSQTVYFARSLQQRVGSAATTVHCIGRTPLETESRLPLVFYQKGLPGLSFTKMQTVASLDSLVPKPKLLAVTFNDVKTERQHIVEMGYRPVLYSSTLLWNINELLARKNINTINDIWVLYQFDDGAKR